MMIRLVNNMLYRVKPNRILARNLRRIQGHFETVNIRKRNTTNKFSIILLLLAKKILEVDIIICLSFACNFILNYDTLGI